MSGFYDYTDKVIKHLNRRFISIFSRAAFLLRTDELNVMTAAKSIYDEALCETLRWYLFAANASYIRCGGKEILTEAWLIGLLSDYDPVTKYVFWHEVERKQARFAEAYIASGGSKKEIDTALRYFSAMVAQYAVHITDEAAVRAYKERGILRVRWVTTPDERRCRTCRERHGAIYDIDKIPPKPHIGCRCRLIPTGVDEL